MFFNFLEELRLAGIPASLKESLTLIDALQRDTIDMSPEQFYYLSRATYVKDESLYDKFDQVFAKVFNGLQSDGDGEDKEIPEDWLRAVTEKFLTDEEMEKLRAEGKSWDDIMKALQDRLDDQEGRHQGGNKWIGTGGTSRYGNSGAAPEGVRVGGASRSKRAFKVWEKREFRNLDQDVELGTRNIKSRCVGCAASPGPGRPRNSISTRRSAAPRAGASSTSICGPSDAMR
jgi:uncharacterized protein with von Willebrand factor type A (vWA) domain